MHAVSEVSLFCGPPCRLGRRAVNGSHVRTIAPGVQPNQFGKHKAPSHAFRITTRLLLFVELRIYNEGAVVNIAHPEHIQIEKVRGRRAR